MPGYKRVFLAVEKNSTTICSVEELVISHYRNQGYSEGSTKAQGRVEGFCTCQLLCLDILKDFLEGV